MTTQTTLFSPRNLSLLMDLYELTMANGYFTAGIKDTRAVFDLFYRSNPDDGGFAIFAGLEQALDYVEHIHFDRDDIDYLRSLGLFSAEFLDYLATFRFTGDIYAIDEGTVVYPNEPLVTVVAPLIEAQIIETAMLSQINHQSLIATKANRIVRAAQGRMVSDMGARRAHNADAAVYGARAAFIGGVETTATLLAGKMFGIPVTGTMAHSWIMSFASEYEAFKVYAQVYGSSSVFLVDTYNTLKSGLPNAIKVARDVLLPAGQRLKGIRIDSGDIAYLSKEARRMLDEAGLEDCSIIASNSLDEFNIRSIISQGGCIDIFGVGERLITSKSDSTFGGVYKLTALEEDGQWVPKIKVSDNVVKITNPGRKDLYRVYDPDGKSIAELIAEHGEPVNGAVPELVSADRPWQNLDFLGCTFKKLQHQVMAGGQRTSKPCPLPQLQDYVREQMILEVREEEQRLDNPDIHTLAMTYGYYNRKLALLKDAEAGLGGE